MRLAIECLIVTCAALVGTLVGAAHGLGLL